MSLVAITDQSVAEDAIKSALAELAEVLTRDDECASDDEPPHEALLVLDNCEQVLDAVAEALGQQTAHIVRVKVLATSRTALGLSEEAVHHVLPLDLPPEHGDAKTIGDFDAIRLFLHRARQASPTQTLESQDLRTVAIICRKLDGIPLALELAANTSMAIGVTAVSSRLDDRFTLLTNGGSNVLPQHQTLKAVFDWSYSLLSELEQYLFRYGATFAPTIALEAAVFIMQRLGWCRTESVEAIAGLVSKNLLSVDPAHGQRFKFLESTRAYAIERLTRDGQLPIACRLHAEFANRALEDLEGANYSRCQTEALAEIDNIRAALAWSLGPDGAVELGIQLAALAAPHFFELSYLDECTHWSLVALGAFERDRRAQFRPQTKLDLLLAYAAGLLYADKPGPKVTQAWQDALDMAEHLRDSESTLRAVWGLWSNARLAGEMLKGLSIARRFEGLVETFHYQRYKPLARRLIGMSLHYVGAHEHGIGDLRRADTSGSANEPGASPRQTRGLDDFAILAKSTLARALWCSGKRDEAKAVALAAETLASQRGTGRVIANVLVEAAIPLALLTQNSHDALEKVEELRRVARRSGLRLWDNFSEAFACAAHVVDGQANEDLLCKFARAMEALQSDGLCLAHPILMLFQARGHELANEVDTAREIIANALLHCKRRGSRWMIQELSEASERLASLHHSPSGIGATLIRPHCWSGCDARLDRASISLFRQDPVGQGQCIGVRDLSLGRHLPRQRGRVVDIAFGPLSEPGLERSAVSGSARSNR